MSFPKNCVLPTVTRAKCAPSDVEAATVLGRYGCSLTLLMQEIGPLQEIGPDFDCRDRGEPPTSQGSERKSLPELRQWVVTIEARPQVPRKTLFCMEKSTSSMQTVASRLKAPAKGEVPGSQ